VTQPELLTWDWRGQPDLDELARILLEVSAGTVHLHQVDTGGDEYAIVLADRALSDREALDVYERQSGG
jgi:hypothetical protein